MDVYRLQRDIAAPHNESWELMQLSVNFIEINLIFLAIIMSEILMKMVVTD